MLNSLFVERFSEFNPYSKDNTFKTFVKWARRSPHIMGFVNILATDILSDSVEFIPLNKESGRNKKMNAEKFWIINSGKETAEETLYDFFLNGIGYNWLGKINEEEMKEHMKEVCSVMFNNLEGKELEFKAQSLMTELRRDNPETFVKKLRHIAASTMSINSNATEITGYVQRVGGNTQSFDVDEILTFKFMPFDGEIYPFPPMEALLAEVYLLWLITQNYVSWFENGGTPDNVFILPKELAGSKNHQYLIDTLKKYKKIQNKHGNLVFTGDISIEQLAKVESQMENKDLSLYLVGVLAMMYGIPVSRIPFLVGKAANNGDSGGLADSGYWRKISVWQSKFEDTYNRQLWIPYFGVKMKFRRGYLQDEVRETQNDMQKTSVAEQRIRLGLWTPEMAGNYLNIDVEDINKAQAEKKKRDEEEMRSGMLMQNLDNNSNVLNEPDKKLKNKTKQETQNKNKMNNGGKTINP